MNRVTPAFWENCIYNGPPTTTDMSDVVRLFYTHSRVMGIKFAITNCTSNVMQHVIDPCPAVCRFAIFHYDSASNLCGTAWPDAETLECFVGKFPLEFGKNRGKLSPSAILRLAAASPLILGGLLREDAVVLPDDMLEAAVAKHPAAIAYMPPARRSRAMVLHAAGAWKDGDASVAFLAPYEEDSEVVDAAVRNPYMRKTLRLLPPAALLAAAGRLHPSVAPIDALIRVAPHALPSISALLGPASVTTSTEEITGDQWRAAWEALLCGGGHWETSCWFLHALPTFVAAVPPACGTRDLWVRTAKHDINLLRHCPDLTRDLLHEAAHAQWLSEKGTMFAFVGTWTGEAVVRAVTAEPYTLQWVRAERQTPAVVRAALTGKGNAIQFVAHQTVEWQMLAAAQNPKASRFFTLPPCVAASAGAGTDADAKTATTGAT